MDPPFGSDDRRLQLYGSSRSLKQQPSSKQPPECDSFIVQFPKDQIYHVPPPERTEYIQRLRDEQSNLKPYETRSCKIAAIVIISVIVFTVTLTTIAPLFSPKGPSFSVSRLAVKNSKRGSSYYVTVKAKNPNEGMGMLYNSVGHAFLTFKGEPIGSGNLQDLEQGEGQSSNIRLVLKGSDEEIPKSIKKSFKKSKPKDVVLKMSFSVRLKLGLIKTKASVTDVTCKLRVAKLKGATKILRQRCQT